MMQARALVLVSLAACAQPSKTTQPVLESATPVRVTSERECGYGAGGLAADARFDSVAISAKATFTENGETKSSDGVPTGIGAFEIPGVPAGAAYVLEVETFGNADRPNTPPMWRRYVMPGEQRTVRLGDTLWRRADVISMDNSAKISLSLDTSEAFDSSSNICMHSQSSYFYACASPLYVEEGITHTANIGDTSTRDWTSPLPMFSFPYSEDALGLPKSGDDFLVTHEKQAVENISGGNKFDPFSRATIRQIYSSALRTDINWDNGKTNTLTASLTVPSQRRVLDVQMQGAQFASMRALAGYPKNATATTRITVTEEAGDTEAFVYASTAPTVYTASFSSKPNPLVPSCFPGNSTVCSAGVCPSGCATASDGFVDPGDVTLHIDSPRLYTADASAREHDLIGYAYNFSVPLTLPSGRSFSASAGYSEYRLGRFDGALTFSPALSPPSNVLFDGQAHPWQTATFDVGYAPTITFAAPTTGTPDRYEIEVLELDSDSDLDPALELRLASRLVAFAHTTEPLLKLKEGLLRPGKVYTVRVNAVKGVFRAGTPFTLGIPRIAHGILTPAFAIKASR
jgi:hypothetical protein